MGVVYEADQLDLKRIVAVKLLHPAAPFGPRVRLDALAGREAPAVQRLRAAGATLVGKTNCSELCIGEYVLRAAHLFDSERPGRHREKAQYQDGAAHFGEMAHG